MIMIMASVFLMIGMTIDMSRILLARYTVEKANTSAARSLMAGYNKILMSDYGLYAIQKPEEEADGGERSDIKTFRKYLNSNLLIPNSDSYDYSKRSFFSILRFKAENVGDISIEYSEPIWEDGPFKEQITDYEKYRKYVSLLYQVGDMFKGVFKKDKSAKSMEDADKAKSEMERANDNVKKLNRSGKKLMDWIENKDFWKNLVRYDENTSYKDQYKIFRGKNSVVEGINRIFDQEDTLKTIGKDTIKSVFKTMNKEIGKETKNLDYSDLEGLIDDANAKISDLRESLAAARAQVSQADAGLDTDGTDSGIDPDKYLKNAGATDFDEAIRRIDEAEESINSAETEIREIIKEHERNTEDYALLEKIQRGIYFTLFIHDVKEIAGISDDFVAVIKENVDNALNKLHSDDIRNKLASLRLTAEDLANHTFLNDLGDIMNKIVDKQDDLFNRLEGIKISEAGTITVPEASDDYPGKEEQSEKEGDVEASIDSLSDIIESISSNNLSELFSGEYADRRFSTPAGGWTAVSNVFAALPVANVVSMISDIIEAFVANDSDMDFAYNAALTAYTMEKTNALMTSTRRDHFFRMGETEYVKYGWDRQWQNITNSVSDIISLRFTINFAYYFLKTPGGALVRLAAAGVLGGIRTAADAYGIFVSNDGCALLPNGAKQPKLKYTDYLLIKVFLENHKKVKLLDNIQATLLVRDTERKADLKKMYTAVTTTVEVKVDLIFLKLFGFELIDIGSFNNGYYTVKNTVQMKY